MMSATMRPIFVIGAARSGTSAISLALMRGAGLPGFNEGHVFPMIDQLCQTIDDYYASIGERLLQSAVIMIGSLDPVALKDHMISWFARVIEEQLGAEVWVDKTPDSRMLRAVPRIAELYPQARFIFAKRRGIENVMSRLRKFPERSFEQHCMLWAASMEQWQLARAQLSRACYIEIDQHDVALYPEDTAQRLGTFLGLDADQIGKISRFWLTQRPEQTKTPRDYRYIGLDETGWTEEKKALFVRVCGPAMEQYAYTLGGCHFPDAYRQPVYLFYPVGMEHQHEVTTEDVRDNGFRPVDQGFLLHPNGPKEPSARVRYRSLEFFGHNHFSAGLSLNSSESEPVEFRLLIEHPEKPVPVFESGIEISVGPGVLWDVSLPALEGPYEVVISTTMARDPASNRGARAIWKGAHFFRDER